jgi:hypothetical protein
MDMNPTLFTFVIAALIVVALLIIGYWLMYTRRLRTPAHVGKNEGIAMATDERERRGNPNHAG